MPRTESLKRKEETMLSRAFIVPSLAIALTGLAGAAVALQPCSEGAKSAEARITRHEIGTIAEVAAANPDFKTLVTAASAAGLIETLGSKGPFTVFAPTNEAFAKVDKNALASLLKPENKDKLRAVILYHVVSGKVESSQALTLTNAATVNGQRIDLKVKQGKLMIDGATVTATDVAASNGVIHVIDTVLMPATENIAGVAQSAGKFKTLLAAAKAAGITDALTGSEPLTVLAPTDEAFEKLPKGAVENLLKPENKETLKKVLLLHVVPGRVYSDQVVKLTSAKSLDGQTLTPAAKDGKVMINGAQVIAADIEATNGVVHVIDTVLMPK